MAQRRSNRLEVGRNTLKTTAGLALAAGLLVLVGCDRETPDSKVIAKASGDISRVTGAGASAPAAPEAKREFGRIVGDLKGVSGAAAAGVSAQATIGLADVEFAAYRAAEREAREKLNLVMPELSSYGERQSAAAAAAGFDPAPQLAEINTSRQQKRAEAEKLRQQRRVVETQVNELREQAKTRMTAAAAKTDEYSRLIQPTSTMSATAAAPIVENANRIRREADLLRLEGAKIEADADKIAPELTESQLMIDSLLNQVKGLDTYEADLNARLEASRKESTEARAAATAAAERAGALIEEARAIRAERVDSAAKSVVSKLNEVLSSAKKSNDASAATAKITQAAAQQALAQLHIERARGMVAAMLACSRLATAEPALPKRAEFKTEADKYVKEAQDSYLEAKKFIEEAGGSLKGIQLGSGPSAAATKEQLSALSEKLQAKGEELKALAEEVETLPSLGAPTPDLTVSRFTKLVKAGEYAKLVDLIDTPSEASKKAIGAMLAITPTSLKLDAAAKAKFGKTFTEAQKEMMGGETPGSSGLLDLASFADLDPAEFKIETKDDSTATVSHPKLGGKSTLKLVNGKWLIHEPRLIAAAPMMAPMMSKLGPIMDELLVDIEAGKYESIQAAMQAMMQKVMGAAAPGGASGGPDPTK